MRRLLVLLPLLLAPPLAAQDTTQFREGVRVGVDYVPGTRPGLVVLPGAGLDTLRAMVRRDLDYSDRFEMIQVDDAPPGGAVGAMADRLLLNVAARGTARRLLERIAEAMVADAG